MTIYAVEYVYDTARTEDLDKVRAEHREFLQGLHEAGDLITSGPWADAATPGALVLVRAADHEEALRILEGDPFHRAHLIANRTARAWNPVIGDLA